QRPLANRDLAALDLHGAVAEQFLPQCVRVGVAIDDDGAVLFVGKLNVGVGKYIDRSVGTIVPCFGIEASLVPGPLGFLRRPLGADDEDHAVTEGIAERTVAMRAFSLERRLTAEMPIVASAFKPQALLAVRVDIMAICIEIYPNDGAGRQLQVT